MNRAFSLLEVLIAMVVLGIATFALTVTLSSSLRLDEATQEEIEANALVNRQTEVLYGLPFSTIIETYYNAGLGAPSNVSPKEELMIREAPGWTHPVRIQPFLTEDLSAVYDGGMESDPNDAGAVMRAKYATVAGQPEWGTRQVDLDSDGTTTGTFTTDESSVRRMQMLPVRITVKWVSRAGGVNRIDRHLFLANRYTDQSSGGR